MKIQHLLEARKNASHPAQQKLTGMQPLEKYFGKGVGNYYVSYTQIDKLGINPNSRFQTPIGIYTYPMKLLSNIHKMDEVPYAGDEPYLFVVTPTLPVIVLNTYDNLDNDIAKITSFLETEFPELKAAEIINDAITNARHCKNMDASRMWNLCRTIGIKYAIKSKANNSSVYFNYMLRKVLGYNIIRDNGMGLIHPAEKTQCVFLSKDALKVVDKIKNTRTNLGPESIVVEKQLQQFYKEYNAIEFSKNPKPGPTGSCTVTAIAIPTPMRAELYFRVFHVTTDDEDINKPLIIKEEIRRFGGFYTQHQFLFESMAAPNFIKIVKKLNHPTTIQHMIAYLVDRLSQKYLGTSNVKSYDDLTVRRMVNGTAFGHFLLQCFPEAESQIFDAVKKEFNVDITNHDDDLSDALNS